MKDGFAIHWNSKYVIYNEPPPGSRSEGRQKNGKGVSEEFTDEATALFIYSRHTRFAGGQTDGAQAPAQGQRARVGSYTQTNAQTTQGTGLQTTGDHACLLPASTSRNNGFEQAGCMHSNDTNKTAFPESFS